MLKLTGCVFILTAFTLSALYYNGSLKQRISLLENIHDLLMGLKIVIVYENISIPEALQRIGNENKCTEKIIKSILNKMSSGYSLKTAWVNSMKELSILKEEDLTLLYEFSSVLGDTDISGQISNIELYICKIDENTKKHRKKYDETSRISICCAISIGLIVSVVLI